MKNYLKNWNFMRLFRLVLGVLIIMQGVHTGQWVFILLGCLFSLMPLLNIGCCTTSGCSTPTSKTNKKQEQIEYEEVR